MGIMIVGVDGAAAKRESNVILVKSIHPLRFDAEECGMESSLGVDGVRGSGSQVMQGRSGRKVTLRLIVLQTFWSHALAPVSNYIMQKAQ